MVKAAAMNKPGCAIHAGIHKLPFAEGKIEPDEMETRTNPRNTDNQMEPAQKEVEPVNNKGRHRIIPNKFYKSCHNSCGLSSGFQTTPQSIRDFVGLGSPGGKGCLGILSRKVNHLYKAFVRCLGHFIIDEGIIKSDGRCLFTRISIDNT